MDYDALLYEASNYATQTAEAVDAFHRVGGAAFEDSTADELGKSMGWWGEGNYGPPAPNTDNDTDWDYYGPVYGGPVQDGNSYIDIPGAGPVDVQVVPQYAGGAPLTPQQAMQALAEMVIRNPEVLSLIRDRIGAVIRPAPVANGQVIERYALSIMYEELDSDYRKPLAQFLAGFEAPMALTNKQEEVFLLLKLSDAFEANNILPRP